LQETIIQALKLSRVQQTQTVKQPPTPYKWTYASAFLYSLTLITTIGTYVYLRNFFTVFQLKLLSCLLSSFLTLLNNNDDDITAMTLLKNDIRSLKRKRTFEPFPKLGL
jgi:hypothetical protein